jgi:hypothetical protein
MSFLVRHFNCFMRKLPLPLPLGDLRYNTCWEQLNNSEQADIYTTALEPEGLLRSKFEVYLS